MYIYRIKDNTKIIVYVGITKNLKSRHACHSVKGEILEYIKIENSSLSCILELYLINKYKPKFNKDGKYEDIYYNKDLELYDCNWKTFDEYKDSIIIKTKYTPKLTKKEDEIIKCENTADLSNYILKEEHAKYIAENFFTFKKLNKLYNNFIDCENTNSFSTSWIHKTTEENIIKINKNLINIFINKSKGYISSSNIWTCNCWDKIIFNKRPKYLNKSWKNEDSNIISKNIKHVGIISNYYEKGQVGTYPSKNNDEYALKKIVYFLSHIEPIKGNKTFLYLPSIRMRNILLNWLNSFNYTMECVEK